MLTGPPPKFNGTRDILSPRRVLTDVDRQDVITTVVEVRRDGRADA
jgi:hypothetical protein